MDGGITWPKKLLSAVHKMVKWFLQLNIPKENQPFGKLFCNHEKYFCLNQQLPISQFFLTGCYLLQPNQQYHSFDPCNCHPTHHFSTTKTGPGNEAIILFSHSRNFLFVGYFNATLTLDY
jgi:hypothetical protein